MSTRTVRLDYQTDELLKKLVRTTGLSISGVLKQGLFALQERLAGEPHKTAFEIYREFDLGPGGYAIGPSSETKRTVAAAIRRKHGR
jgi:hypothetical protein